jgi:hypothetical protein
MATPEQLQQDLSAALRQVENLTRQNEKQRQKISELRRTQSETTPATPKDAPPATDVFSHKKEDMKDDEMAAERILKLKFAWYRHHLVLSSKLKMRVARAFDKWKNLSLQEERRAALRREHMKIQVQQSKIKSERSKIERIVLDMHRIRYVRERG